MILPIEPIYFDDAFLDATPLIQLVSTINVVSAKCGAGKTTVLCSYIPQALYRTNILVAFPTLKLLHQFAESLDVNPKIITSETNPEAVGLNIHAHLNDSFELGSLLLTTHAGLLNLPYFPNRDDWEVFMDELPNIDEFYSYKLPENPDRILDYIETTGDVMTSGKTSVIEIIVKPDKRHELEQLVLADPDTVKENFIKLYRDLISEYKEVFTTTASLETLRTRGNKNIHFLSILNPDRMIGWTIMSAHIESSLFYLWFEKRHNINFRPFTDLTNELRKMPDKKVDIFYCIDGTYSKSLRDNPDWNVGEQINILFSTHTEGGEWLYSTNLDNKFIPKNVQTLPPKAHGLNTYRHYTNIALSYTENRPPSHIRMWSALGINSDELKMASYYQSIYQLVSRTEIRDADRDSGIQIIVIDKGAAYYLASVYGSNTRVSKIGNIRTGSPTLTKKQKDTRYRNKNIVEKLQHTRPNAVGNNTITVTIHNNDQGGRNKKVNLPSYKKLFTELKKSAGTVKYETESLHNINAGVFNTDIAGRTPTEFISSDLIILNFDDGDFSIDDFITLFGTNKNRKLRHTFFICNSWSRSNEQPNCFHVIMPTNITMTSISEYKAVYNYVMSRIFELESDTGIDPNSGSGVIDIPFPCINIDQQEWAFCETHGTDKQLLPVDVIIDNKIEPEPKAYGQKPTKVKCNHIDQLGN